MARANDGIENGKCGHREAKNRGMTAAQQACKVVGRLVRSTQRKEEANGPQLPDLLTKSDGGFFICRAWLIQNEYSMRKGK